MTARSELWLAKRPLLLASGSASRRAMLEAAGFVVEIIRPSVDERAIEDPLRAEGADPSAIALALARAKALSVSSAAAGRIVLGADQTLDCGGEGFHKPADLAQAAAQLAALSGHTHTLFSAFALARDGVVLAEAVDRAVLTMRPLSDGFIATYLELVGPAALESVGSYQIEGLGAQLFEEVEGNHFSILGLPLLLVLHALRRLAFLAN